jgi:L-ascorbate metabolism protein UlaG (beta-lactamase superfamily)
MKLRWLGHSCFELTLPGGVIVTDPYGSFYSFPARSLPDDICTVSHDHHDHNAVDTVIGCPQIIRKEGKYRPADDVKVTAVPTWHDEDHGAKRGPNLIFVFEIEGMRIVHCGDLGHVPTREQAKAIGKPDVLLIPVGGFYTIGPQQARDTMELLRPTLTIPMHYRTSFDEDMPIQPLATFLQLTGAADTLHPMLRLTQKDMTQRDAVMAMEILP